MCWEPGEKIKIKLRLYSLNLKCLRKVKHEQVTGWLLSEARRGGCWTSETIRGLWALGWRWVWTSLATSVLRITVDWEVFVSCRAQ